jgi:uncharacterized protein
MIRIVVDTNWWISLLINRYDSQLTNILLRTDLAICASNELIEEVFATLRYPKLEKYLKPHIVNEFVAFFPQAVTLITVTSKIDICRDPKDNFLLSLSKDANADFLITGDKDLLVLNKFENTTILTLTEFVDRQF